MRPAKCRVPIGVLFVMALVCALATLPPATALSSDALAEDDCRSLFGNLHLPVYVYRPAGADPRAIIVALHGGCLHGGSFATLGRRLAELGYCLVSLDMRGYGRWLHQAFGTRKDRQFSYKQSRKDIEAVIECLRTSYPDAPVYCLGESLGANMAMKLAGGSPGLADGVVLVSPFGGPRLFVYPQMLAHLLQVTICPLGKLDMSCYLKRRLSHNREWAREQLEDPLGRNKQSILDLLVSLRSNVAGILHARRIPANTPVLVLQGQKDRLCSPKASMRLYERMPSARKRFELLPDHGHLIVETSYLQPQVIALLDGWFREQETWMRAQANTPFRMADRSDTKNRGRQHRKSALSASL
ncbi:MAG TPA: alpha/beta fold hydrolase [Candidatus Obscuribacterales bacterium]